MDGFEVTGICLYPRAKVDAFLHAHQWDAGAACSKRTTSGKDTTAALTSLGDVDHLRPVLHDGALPLGELLEHSHRLGRLYHPAELAHGRHPPAGHPEHPRPGPRRSLGGLGAAAVPDGGEERGLAPRAHVDVSRRTAASACA
jgi:hypothetical protein